MMDISPAGLPGIRVGGFMMKAFGWLMKGERT